MHACTHAHTHTHVYTFSFMIEDTFILNLKKEKVVGNQDCNEATNRLKLSHMCILFSLHRFVNLFCDLPLGSACTLQFAVVSTTP